mgnify:CR=1 FL=1
MLRLASGPSLLRHRASGRHTRAPDGASIPPPRLEPLRRHVSLPRADGERTRSDRGFSRGYGDLDGPRYGPRSAHRGRAGRGGRGIADRVAAFRDDAGVCAPDAGCDARRSTTEVGSLAIHAPSLLRAGRRFPSLDGVFCRNRRLFEERLDQEILFARRYGTTPALLWIGVDGLEAINDCCGHGAGIGSCARWAVS